MFLLALVLASLIHSALVAIPMQEEDFLLVNDELNADMLVGADMPLGQKYICEDFVIIGHPNEAELVEDEELVDAALHVASRMASSVTVAGIVDSCPKVGEVEIIEDDFNGNLWVKC